MPAETRQRDDAGQAGAWLVAGRSGAEASAFTPPGAARRRPARVISLPHVLCGRLLDVSARLPAVEVGRFSASAHVGPRAGRVLSVAKSPHGRGPWSSCPRTRALMGAVLGRLARGREPSWARSLVALPADESPHGRGPCSSCPRTRALMGAVLGRLARGQEPSWPRSLVVLSVDESP